MSSCLEIERFVIYYRVIHEKGTGNVVSSVVTLYTLYVYLSLCKQRVHSWTEVGVRPVLNSHEIFLLILKPMPKPSSKVLKTKSFNEGF